MNHRHRAEISFLARIVYLLILGGVWTAHKKQHEDLEQIAYEAMTLPLQGLTDKDRKSIIRRVCRMEDKTIKPLSGKTHGRKVALIVYYFTNDLIDRNYLEMPEGSSLAIITDFLLGLINPEDTGVQKQMESAKKQAGKWLEQLQLEGYYR